MDSHNHMSAEELGKKAGRPSPQSTHYCDAAKRLLDAFGREVQELMALHELQFLAIVEGDSDAGRFDLLIHEATERKQNAKYAYLIHLESHGCSYQR